MKQHLSRLFVTWINYLLLIRQVYFAGAIIPARRCLLPAGANFQTDWMTTRDIAFVARKYKSASPSASQNILDIASY